MNARHTGAARNDATGAFVAMPGAGFVSGADSGPGSNDVHEKTAFLRELPDRAAVSVGTTMPGKRRSSTRLRHEPAAVGGPETSPGLTGRTVRSDTAARRSASIAQGLRARIDALLVCQVAA